MPNPDSNQQQALSVSELNRYARQLLEGQLSEIWVNGEISNFTRPASGHWYFTLKDQQAQIRCAMFRGRNMLTGVQPKSGDQVIVRGKISLYEARGDYQLIAESLKPAGEGQLQQQFEQLKQRLFEEGLFNPEHKRPLPTEAKRIAVISSATGAAVHDILQVLKRRDPNLEVVLVPSAVQGAEAPAELLNALQRAQQIDNIDAIIIGRGGGSLEDLWAFNNEQLARAIFHCSIPIISAVGHEIDFSISDFVADVRAPTPSAAAELISRERSQDRLKLQNLHQRLQESWLRLQQRQQHRLQQLSKQLKHPGEKIEQWQQRCDRAELNLNNIITQRLNLLSRQNEQQQRLLLRLNPAHNLRSQRQQMAQFDKRLHSACQHVLHNKKQQFSKLAAELDIISPLATLSRGYSITKNQQGKVLSSVKQIKANQNINIQLSDGSIDAKVDAVFNTLL